MRTKPGKAPLAGIRPPPRRRLRPSPQVRQHFATLLHPPPPPGVRPGAALTMHPTVWPDADELLLVVAHHTDGHRLAAALDLATWTDDDLTVPWLGHLLIDANDARIRLYAFGIMLHDQTGVLPAAWASNVTSRRSCLLGIVTESPVGSGDHGSIGERFRTQLDVGEAAIAEVELRMAFSEPPAHRHEHRHTAAGGSEDNIELALCAANTTD